MKTRILLSFFSYFTSSSSSSRSLLQSKYIFNYCLDHLDTMIHILTARTLYLSFLLSFFTLSYLPLQYYCCNSILSSYYWHQCDNMIHFWRRALFIYLYSFLYCTFLSIINNIFISFRPIIYIVLTEEYTFWRGR